MTAFLFSLLTAALLSEEELRFAYNGKQGADTSCGIAATASLLRYWNTPVAEADLYQEMIFNNAREGDANYSVSFKTIMDCLSRYGLAARGYKMNWGGLRDALEKGYAPILIHYDKPNPHFALLLHIEGGYAFAADPAKGFEFVDQREFERNYSGNALLAASVRAEKNGGYIESLIAKEMGRLDALRRLAASRTIRARQ
jgi:ABC-type bacteriocin/lantibiotic exporter with double-glycine peptidase domain